MRIRSYFLIPIIICIFIIGCEQETSYSVPETLFEEILRAEDPLDPRVLENNWKAFEELGKAYREQGDLLKTTAVFTTFLSAKSGFDETEYDTPQYNILIEYGANLLKATPPDAVLLVYFDEVYYLTMFAREVLGIKPRTPIIWAKATPEEKYKEHLKKEYGISIPPNEDVFEDPTKREREAIILKNCKWLIESLGKPVYLSPNVPYAVRPNCTNQSLGPGVLYGTALSDRERIELEIALIEDTLVFEAVSDTTVQHPDMVRSFVQWYSDPMLVHGRQLLMEGDTAGYARILDVLIERLPTMWKPAAAYLQLFPNTPEEKRQMLLNRIERYIRLNPSAKRPQNAYDDIIEGKNQNGGS